MRALDRGHVELAAEQLAEAAQSDPTRPSYSAALALARTTLLTEEDRALTASEREEIVALCRRALQGMAGAFFPSRDAEACEMVADVYARLGGPGDKRTATELRRVARAVRRHLGSKSTGGSVSGIFLEAIQRSKIQLSDKIGEYGREAQQARAHLLAGGWQARANGITRWRSSALLLPRQSDQPR